MELPSAKYLNLHAACCKIARMAGAAEYFEMFDKDFHADAGSGQMADFAAALTTRLYDVTVPCRLQLASDS